MILIAISTTLCYFRPGVGERLSVSAVEVFNVRDGKPNALD